MFDVLVRLRTIGLGLASAGFLAVALVTPVQAQLNDAENTAESAVTEGAASQERINNLDDQTEQLLREYRVVVERLEAMREYNDQQERLIDAQVAEIASLESQIENVTTLQRDISPLITRMLEGLRVFVDLDVPFLPEERQERVERLTALMDRADISVAEKFRRVLEAYQIENDYGRTIESYVGTLERDGEVLELDFLKVGRVAFFYQTKDQSQSAIWNQDTHEWQILPDRFNSQVRTGINMAREVIPPEILILPVHVSAEEIE
ncbi:MAG: DUF3450 domain-containing protein [Sphingomonadales bacterium]|nr:MAG: DUF3450 domain-containing protein [Sphingomonadales bacterium]